MGPVSRALLLIAAVLLSMSSDDTRRFTDVTSESGLDFVHHNGKTEEKYLVETMGSGGGFLDYDGDGDLDIYLVNGAALPGSQPAAVPPTNALYRNDGASGFVDVTARAGVGDASYGMGMTAGDIDNDGDVDLYVTNFGPDVFYLNNGDGTFSDQSASAGLGLDGFSSSASFGDYDADGFVDLYVARYVDFALDNHKFCGNQAKKINAYCHPDVYEPVPSALFRNLGDGSFEDVTSDAGLYRTDEGKSLGVVWGDYDADGDLDLYVANDSMRNFLYRNDGDGRFSDVTLLAGVGYSEDGQTQAGMGTDMADYDGDGRMDLTVTNLDFEYNALYRGSESGLFVDASYAAGVAETTLNFVGFGTFFFDYDNDGWLDLFVANGHIIDNIELFSSLATYEERNFVFRNTGEGTFSEVGATLGEAMSRDNVGRGAVSGDFDQDGDPDVLVTRCGQSAQLLRNDGDGSDRSLSLRLVGRTGNRDGIGVRVIARIGDRVLVRELKAGVSYLSQGSLELHFGLDAASRVDELEIRWGSGPAEHRFDVPAGRHVLVEPVVPGP